MVAEYRRLGITLTSQITQSPNIRSDGSRTTIERMFTPDGRTAAVVHYFEFPDGRIGASGRKDPKRAVFEGVDYRERPAEDE
jgi:hypothetical protein